jgi:hypothetical protein
MEGSHPESVRKASDSDAMALLSTFGAPSYAPEDPLKATESSIASLIDLDPTDLALPGRLPSIPPGPSLDDI